MKVGEGRTLTHYEVDFRGEVEPRDGTRQGCETPREPTGAAPRVENPSVPKIFGPHTEGIKKQTEFFVAGQAPERFVLEPSLSAFPPLRPEGPLSLPYPGSPDHQAGDGSRDAVRSSAGGTGQVSFENVAITPLSRFHAKQTTAGRTHKASCEVLLHDSSLHRVVTADTTAPPRAGPPRARRGLLRGPHGGPRASKRPVAGRIRR